MRDPWDVDPEAFEEDEHRPPDPEEVLAKAIWRTRPEHKAGAHLLGDWRGYYHGIRAGNARLRAEGERALLAQRVQTHASRASTVLASGDSQAAKDAFLAALREIPG